MKPKANNNTAKLKTYNRADGSSFYRKTIRILGKKLEKTFTRKTDPDKWYQEKKREKELIERGLALQADFISVSDFASKWHEKRRSNGKPLSSWLSDNGRLEKWILPHFGKRDMNSISTIEWEDFLDGLVANEKISAATRNRIRSLATKMYNDGIRQKLLAHNPVSVIPKLKESMDAWDYWATKEDIIKYLEAAHNESPMFYVFANVSLNLGTRIGETLALDLGDINLDQNRIGIEKILEEVSGQVCDRTKAHKKRWLGINDSLKEVIHWYKSVTKHNKPKDPLLCNENGERINGHSIRKIHDRVCKTADVKPIRVHDLRHTYASHYIMNGGALADLQALLGHSTPNMTLKYAHLAPGFLEKKAEVVSFGISENKKSNLVSLKLVK